MLGMRMLALSLALLGSGCSACGSNDPPKLPPCANPVSGTTITTRKIGSVNGSAVLATSPPLDLRLFVLEQNGAIRIFDHDQLVPTPFLDISDKIVAGGEQGLLGLAFHPHYASNGKFYVFYTLADANVVASCQVSKDPNVAMPSCTPILSIADFAANHNAGMMEFGRDGYLYISTGDGGGAGDPMRTAQDPNQLLGKMLRIDVDHPSMGKPYGIPSDNPFAKAGGAPEVYMLGLRNPWRWSFDSETGDLWIGDVGQGAVEEIDVLHPGQQAGANLGWSMYEGTTCYYPPCDATGKVMPLDTRAHSDGWVAIIGGETYRGTCYPDLVGWYFYTDYGAGGLTKARLGADGKLEIVAVPGTFPGNVSSIHADARGEIYLTDTSGGVHHLEAGP